MRVYVIGDVHGHLGLLADAHARILEDRRATGDAEAPVVHLGDLCDRGPDTRGVMDFLVEGRDAGEPWRIVRGNHDAIFAEFLSGNVDAGMHWLTPNMGGAETLASYGVEDAAYRDLEKVQTAARAAVPGTHLSLLDALERYVETDDLILVHAGIRPGVPLAEQNDEDLIWIRAPFLYDTRDHGKLVVHGHTPVDVPTHCGNRVALDTGAAWGGKVTAAVFEGRDCFILTEAGRVALPPP